MSHLTQLYKSRPNNFTKISEMRFIDELQMPTNNKSLIKANCIKKEKIVLIPKQNNDTQKKNHGNLTYK